MSTPLRNAAEPELTERAALMPGREHFLLPQVGHEELTCLVGEADVVYREHAHAEADLGANRIQRAIERLLGDAELRHPHGKHAILAPHEEGQRRLHWSDLERAGFSERVVRLELLGC